ncbi:hypothetical protein C7B80_03035 [Cyanosarcina cf. burmensis CCALA 770]|nr:hypothetical protein C7B80_03035 [Cyanosarcina cf. burmensis CCALA 770]
MTKPNFKEMSRADLRTYVTEHRDDEEAWDAFFAKLEQERSPDTKWYPAPLNEESIRIGEEAIRQKIQEIENRRSLENEN